MKKKASQTESERDEIPSLRALIITACIDWYWYNVFVQQIDAIKFHCMRYRCSDQTKSGWFFFSLSQHWTCYTCIVCILPFNGNSIWILHSQWYCINDFNSLAANERKSGQRTLRATLFFVNRRWHHWISGQIEFPFFSHLFTWNFVFLTLSNVWFWREKRASKGRKYSEMMYFYDTHNNHYQIQCRECQPIN